MLCGRRGMKAAFLLGRSLSRRHRAELGDFTLVIESDSFRRACHMARTNANRLGVAFQ